MSESMDEKGYYWTEFMVDFATKFALAPACPFCGASIKKLESIWVKRGGRVHQVHRICCQQCGASGAEGDTPDEAVDEWSRRPGNSWQLIGPHSYTLPEQRYNILLVYNNPRHIALVHDEDGKQSIVEVDLGHFRLCYRHKEGEKVRE